MLRWEFEMLKKAILGLSITLTLVTFIGCEENKDAVTYIENNTPIKEVQDTKEETIKPTEEKTERTLDDYITFRSKLEASIGLGESECYTLYFWCRDNEEIMMFEKALSPNIFDLCPKLLDEE